MLTSAEGYVNRRQSRSNTPSCCVFERTVLLWKAPWRPFFFRQTLPRRGLRGLARCDIYQPPRTPERLTYFFLCSSRRGRSNLAAALSYFSYIRGTDPPARRHQVDKDILLNALFMTAELLIWKGIKVLWILRFKLCVHSDPIVRRFFFFLARLPERRVCSEFSGNLKPTAAAAAAAFGIVCWFGSDKWPRKKITNFVY